jgi:hypothetical protein
MECPTWDGVLLAGAAIFAAAVAAWTANYRMGKQLEHDRKMRDRDELRKALDEIAVSAGLAADQVNLARAATPVLGYDPKSEEPNALAQLDDRKTSLQKAHQLVYSLASQGQRLHLRFRRDHPIPVAYWELRERIVELILLVDVGEELWTVEQSEKIDAKVTEVGRANIQFVGACRPEVLVA